MKYDIKVDYLGHLLLRGIEAESEEEAKEKAVEMFWNIWENDPDTILNYIKTAELHLEEREVIK